MAGMMTYMEHIKINWKFRPDILSISETYIIHRVLAWGGVSGWIGGGVGGLHHIWQVSVSIMAPLLWSLSGKGETHTKIHVLHNIQDSHFFLYRLICCIDEQDMTCFICTPQLPQKWSTLGEPVSVLFFPHWCAIFALCCCKKQECFYRNLFSFLPLTLDTVFGWLV